MRKGRRQRQTLQLQSVTLTRTAETADKSLYVANAGEMANQIALESDSMEKTKEDADSLARRRRDVSVCVSRHCLHHQMKMLQPDEGEDDEGDGR